MISIKTIVAKHMIGPRYHFLNTIIFTIFLLGVNKFLFTNFEIGVPINLNNIILFLFAGLIISIFHPIIFRRILKNPRLQSLLLFIGIVSYFIELE